MRKFLLAFFCILSSVAFAQVWQYVDPRIGSVGVGRTFPGPCMPFGMVKPGPDCGILPNAGWALMPAPVFGFSQTHVSGTGGGQKYGNILIQPYLTEDTSESQSSAENSCFQRDMGWLTLPQQRANEDIALGYYSTTYENGIQTEITTSDRCSFYRFRYPKNGSLFVDATHFLGKDTVPNLRERQQFVDAHLEIIGNHEVTGYSTIRGGWNNGGPYTVFFCLQTDQPFSSDTCLVGDEAVTTSSSHAFLRFTSSLVNVKIGISYVSIEQARRNIPSHGFDTQLPLLQNAWEQQLSKIHLTASEQQKRMFYTALYHTMLMPVDKTGETPFPLPFREGQGVGYYDDFYAIWDTYRTSSPLLTLLCPERQIDIINSLLNIYTREGYLPDARSGDCNGRTQGGSNAEVVIADAFAKGLGRSSSANEDVIDYSLALEAMLKDATVPPADDEKEGRGGLTEYNRLGYIPYGIDRAGNRTVEYAFNDWCIAQVAQGLGKKAVYKEYMAKSRNWKNLWRSDFEWDDMRGFILPKDADGRWMDSVPWGRSKVFHPTIPYTPVTKVAPWYLPWWSTFFYEATSEEYSLSIPHDVPGLIRACGGKKAFRQRLDLFFEKGYYNVQNEPSFLTPCLYHWIGRPDLSSQRIHQIIRDHYTDAPDGLPGNDDSGAMSSWLAFHMMGFYPNAGTDYYLLSLPILPSYTFTLSNGRTLHVSTIGAGDTFHSVTFNGKKLKNARITHTELMKGGELVFVKTASAENDKLQSAKNKEKRQQQPLRATIVSQSNASAFSPEGTGEIFFTLNRQFRTWPFVYRWEGDTLSLTCKKTTYRIPRRVVEHANNFCWLSPQTDGTIHHNAKGTFGFISFDAFKALQSTGTFIYDDITWRLIGKTETTYHVRADVDNTEMWIAIPDSSDSNAETNSKAQIPLPFVLEMRHNPLGIDWKLTPQTFTQQ
ncbi:MAG: GH92 family glycosyl hydrolase [Prevotella sp.]|nr:GH92 family glycosyl hydrolase [Prevotella sp.]